MPARARFAMSVPRTRSPLVVALCSVLLGVSVGPASAASGDRLWFVKKPFVSLMDNVASPDGSAVFATATTSRPVSRARS